MSKTARTRTIKLAVDANEANTPLPVGSGVYTLELLKHWSKKNSLSVDCYLKSPPLPTLPAATDSWRYHVLRPRHFWLHFALPLHLSRVYPEHEVFFSPAHYTPPLTGIPLVVTIHDLAFEYFPEQFLPRDLYKLRKWTALSVRRAHCVIAVSENTKRDIIKYYQVPADKITVIHNGYDRERFQARAKLNPSFLKAYNLTPLNYILHVGTIQPRKNIISLVRAFESLKASGAYRGKLVLAGRTGWLSEDTLASIRSSPFGRDIVLTGYVPVDKQSSLYHGASILVLPSLYEGFGIPALEAMACGTPVAASNNSSLPEVVGRGGEYFDATSQSEIAGKILTVLKNRARYIPLALTQARKFSWERTASQTLRVLEKASLRN